MIYLLSFLTVLLLILIYVIEKDVISPSFIFCLVFMVAEFNVISNVTKLGVKFRVDTVLVVILGIFIFLLVLYWQICFQNVLVNERKI